MIFSSLLFLFRFLPVVLLVYYLVPSVARNLVLLIFSLVFYAWGEPVYVLLMIFSILITYTGGRLVDYFRQRQKLRQAKISLGLTVAAGLSLLGFFKYANFLIRSVNDFAGTGIDLLKISLPIGISFYTFQTISYVIDVYRGDAQVQKNVISYGAYVTMFPQLIAGPIVQYRTIDRQLRSRRESALEFSLGVHRFMIGLGKKVLLANNAGAVWDKIHVRGASGLSFATAWLGLAAFTFQIYFDFSAYSDMAIGLGHMLGFSFLENFRYPYESKSVTEFWRRWHISLGTWFREYVYIPLGGNRAGTARLIFNTMAVWLLTGIWHGADWNFFLWGIYYGILLLVEKLLLRDRLEKLPAFFRHVYTMFLVMIGWLIFSWGDITDGPAYVRALFGQYGFLEPESIYLFYTNAVLLLILCLGATSLPARAGQRLREKLRNHDTAYIVVHSLFYIGIFLLSTAFLVDASYNPFLYFRF